MIDTMHLLPPGLTKDEWTVIMATASGAVVVQLAWFLCWNRFYIETERQRAYVLSLLSSFVTSMGSLPYVYQVLFQQRGNLHLLLVANSAHPSSFFSLLSVALTAFFMTFLCLDLLVGWIHYRSKIDMLTGWIHHITYFCVLTWVLKQHYTGIFIAMCLLEVPTFLLALGSLHRPWRRDYLFASTFLSTRIVFHTFMISSAFTLFRFGPITLALSAFLPVHIYWFIGFIKQQKRLYRQRKVELAKSDPITVADLEISSSSTLATVKPTETKERSPIIKRQLPSSSSSALQRRRRHLLSPVPPTDFNFNLPYPSQQMIQRLADRLPDSFSRDLYRSSEKLWGLWDLAYRRLQEQQNDPHPAPAPAVAAH